MTHLTIPSPKGIPHFQRIGHKPVKAYPDPDGLTNYQCECGFNFRADERNQTTPTFPLGSSAVVREHMAEKHMQDHLAENVSEPQFHGMRFGSDFEVQVWYEYPHPQGARAIELVSYAEPVVLSWGKNGTNRHLAQAMFRCISSFIGVKYFWTEADIARLSESIVSRLPKHEWVLSFDTILQWLDATQIEKLPDTPQQVLKILSNPSKWRAA